MPITPRDIAREITERHHHYGYTLKGFLKCHSGGGSPKQGNRPVIQWVMNNSNLHWSDMDREPIHVQYGQIGVLLKWAEDREEYAIFDIRELWAEVVNPQPIQPVQLLLWGTV